MAANIDSNNLMGTWTLFSSGRSIPLWLYRRLLYTFHMFVTASPNGVREIVQLQFNVTVDDDMLACVYRALITLPPYQLRRLRHMQEKDMEPRPGAPGSNTLITRSMTIIPFHTRHRPPRIQVVTGTDQRPAAPCNSVIDLTQVESSEDEAQILESQWRHTQISFSPHSSHQARIPFPGMFDTVTQTDESESAKELSPCSPAVQPENPVVAPDDQRQANEEATRRNNWCPYTSPPTYPEAFPLQPSIQPPNPVAVVDAWRQAVLSETESRPAQIDEGEDATGFNEISDSPALSLQQTLPSPRLPAGDHNNSDSLFIPEDTLPDAEPESLFIPEDELPDDESETLFIPEEPAQAVVQLHSRHVDTRAPDRGRNDDEGSSYPAATEDDVKDSIDQEFRPLARCEVDGHRSPSLAPAQADARMGNHDDNATEQQLPELEGAESHDFDDHGRPTLQPVQRRASEDQYSRNSSINTSNHITATSDNGLDNPHQPGGPLASSASQPLYHEDDAGTSSSLSSLSTPSDPDMEIPDADNIPVRHSGIPDPEHGSPASNDDSQRAKVAPDLPVGTRRRDRYGNMMFLIRLPYSRQLRWVPAPRETPFSPPRPPRPRRREDSELRDSPGRMGPLRRQDPLYAARRAREEREAVAPPGDDDYDDDGDDEAENSSAQSDNDTSTDDDILPSIEEPDQPTTTRRSQRIRERVVAEPRTPSPAASHARERGRGRPRGRPTGPSSSRRRSRSPAARHVQARIRTNPVRRAAQRRERTVQRGERIYRAMAALYGSQRGTARIYSLVQQHFRRQRRLEPDEHDLPWRSA